MAACSKKSTSSKTSPWAGDAGHDSTTGGGDGVEQVLPEAKIANVGQSVLITNVCHCQQTVHQLKGDKVHNEK